MDSVEDLIRLLLCPEIGPVTFRRLREHFGSARAIIEASRVQLAEVEGVSESQAEALSQAKSNDPRPELERAAEAGVTILTHDGPGFPRSLLHSFDPPPLLYVRGTLTPEDAVAVGMVGTRRCSLYGKRQAELLSGMLCRSGFTVISGLARGIDAAAHRGALDARGRTIAVLGSGLNHVYPRENRDLYEEICATGAVISEFPMDLQPDKSTFPRRNRVVAGLSLGVVVVEAPSRSGALITARLANEMGREVMAVPGRIDQRVCEGCHQLIRRGATLVTGIGDILEALGDTGHAVQGSLFEADSEYPADPKTEDGSEPPAPAPAPTADPVRPATPTPTPARPTPQPEPSGNRDGRNQAVMAREQAILGALGEERLHIDQLCQKCEMPIHELSAALMLMELRRLVKQLPGKFYERGSVR